MQTGTRQGTATAVEGVKDTLRMLGRGALTALAATGRCLAAGPREAEAHRKAVEMRHGFQVWPRGAPPGGFSLIVATALICVTALAITLVLNGPEHVQGWLALCLDAKALAR